MKPQSDVGSPSSSASTSTTATISTNRSDTETNQVRNHYQKTASTTDETNATLQIDANKMKQPLISSFKQERGDHQASQHQQQQSLCSHQNLVNNNSSNHFNSSQNSFASSIPVDETVNILLLGETGVGKSTFINAFVNYITYETLEEAESRDPIALIPVSFLLTTGNDFTEQLIKLNVPDRLKNESFRHIGQSVTQRCQSYVFNLPHHGKQKLRIIDTPGFGDTRGLAQDDRNMEHILEYISNLTHLNAICFLLKPNVTRLHIFFRLCITQLHDFFGSNLHQNIIFCFTNSRSTFYTPGDTAPVLKKVLQSLSMVNIPFTKENTFCFDNESFRYLIARKNRITFNEEEKTEYSMSWLKSVIELNRLLGYIYPNRNICYMPEHSQSIKHAQLLINRMVQPILEAIRYFLRNIILYQHASKKRSIVICPKFIDHPITICLSCKHEPYQTAGFWILPACRDEIHDNSHVCFNPCDQHIILNYVLDYNMASDHPFENTEVSSQLSLLANASVILANFILHTSITAKSDLFLIGFKRMIEEEQYIYKQKKRSYNKRLSEDLQQLVYQYKSRLNEVKQSQKHIELVFIYNWISMVQNIPAVRSQLDAIKDGQKHTMDKYEYDVSNTKDSFIF